MAVNLLNEAELNTYLGQIAFAGETPPKIHHMITPEDIRGQETTIARFMVYKWLCQRVRHYFEKYQGHPFLEPVDQSTPDLPAWALRNLSDHISVYRFCKDKIPSEIKDTLQTASDVLYFKALTYLQKHQKQTDTKKGKAVFLRTDYLKMKNRPELQSIETVLSEIAQKEQAKELQKKSLENVETVMTFPNGVCFVRLKTEKALVEEGLKMEHCAGTGVYYYYNAPDEETRTYSLRDKSGYPHITIEVRGNAVTQCRGRRDTCPTPRYLPYIQQLIKHFDWDIQSDMRAIGLIKQDGIYYDIWHLPAGLIIHQDLDFSRVPWEKLPDMSQITLIGNFTCHRSKIRSLAGMPKKIIGNVDCSSLSEITDLTGIAREVSGFVKIRGCDALISTKGCPDFIGDFWDLSYCAKLSDVSEKPKHLGGLIITEGCVNLALKNQTDSGKYHLIKQKSDREY